MARIHRDELTGVFKNDETPLAVTIFSMVDLANFREQRKHIEAVREKHRWIADVVERAPIEPLAHQCAHCPRLASAWKAATASSVRREDRPPGVPSHCADPA